MPMPSGSIRVLFVCLGNICRSPTAHSVFEELVIKHQMENTVKVDSAGTGTWHIGKAPDARATVAAKRRGYEMSHLIARQVDASDFDHFHFILAMDENNLSDLLAMQPAHYTGHLGLFLDFAEAADVKEVPDPYYGGDEGFEEVLDLVEAASQGLIRQIQQQLAKA